MHAALASQTKLERLPKKLRVFQHTSAFHTKAQLEFRPEPQRWEDYFSFAFVRNPWDRMISGCLFLGLDLEKALTTHAAHWMFRPHTYYVHDADGKQMVNFIGRFENLAQDWATVCGTIGIDAELPHLNQHKEPGYREYYTDRTRDIVAERYREDIETFGYEF